MKARIFFDEDSANAGDGQASRMALTVFSDASLRSSAFWSASQRMQATRMAEVRLPVSGCTREISSTTWPSVDLRLSASFFSEVQKKRSRRMPRRVAAAHHDAELGLHILDQESGNIRSSAAYGHGDVIAHA